MIERETKETSIKASWETGGGQVAIHISGALEGSEPGQAAGREAFAAHMLTALAHWSGANVHLEARSKDGLLHHVTEDAAIGLGQAIRASRGPAIVRMADVLVPMDEALVQVALDVIDRPFYEGPLPDPLLDHMLRSLAQAAGITLHVVVLRGQDPHHIIEAAFKGVGICLGRALAPAPTHRSTKGEVDAC